MKTILFCNEWGIKVFLNALRINDLTGIVVAENRPQSLKIIKRRKDIKKISIFIQPFKKNKEKFQKFVKNLKNLKPDLILVISYSMILPKEILDIPTRGALNIHGSLLPKYRGANALNWVLINGEKETGVTIHYIDEGIDTGDIVAQKKIKISFLDTATTLKEKLAQTTKSLLKKEWSNIVNNNIKRVPQNNSIASTYWRRRPEEGQFNWKMPAIKIYNLIRALIKPYPGAYYFDKKGRKIIIDKFLTLKEIKELQKKNEKNDCSNSST